LSDMGKTIGISDGNGNACAGGCLMNWCEFNVKIYGDYAIVGARYDDDKGSNSGSAYIFKREGLSWTQDLYDFWINFSNLFNGTWHFFWCYSGLLCWNCRYLRTKVY
jgi:hypothetical protein